MKIVKAILIDFWLELQRGVPGPPVQTSFNVGKRSAWLQWSWTDLILVGSTPTLASSVGTTKDVNALQEPIIDYRWWKLLCLAWNDGEMLTREWLADAISTSSKETTQTREWRVADTNVSIGPLSKLTPSKLTNNHKTNWWGIFPREHRVFLWQLHEMVWEGGFASSPNVVGQRRRLYSNVNEEEAR